MGLRLNSDPIALECIFPPGSNSTAVPIICVVDSKQVHCHFTDRYWQSFDLIPLVPSSQELAVWHRFWDGELQRQDAAQALKQLQLLGTSNSTKPIFITPLSQRFATNNANTADATTESQLHSQQDEILCAAVLRKYEADEKTPAYLLLGTESGRLLQLNVSNQQQPFSLRCQLPCAVEKLAVTGLHDVNFTVFMLGRDNAVYLYDGQVYIIYIY